MQHWADSSDHADTGLANKSSKTSIGLRQFNVLRGLPFSFAATHSSSSCECKDRSIPLEVLPEKPVGVLVAAALPRGVGIAEVDGHPGANGEVDVPGRLLALIPGDTVAEELGKGLHFPAQELGDPLGIVVVRDPHQHHGSGGALDQGGDL